VKGSRKERDYKIKGGAKSEGNHRLNGPKGRGGRLISARKAVIGENARQNNVEEAGPLHDGLRVLWREQRKYHDLRGRSCGSIHVQGADLRGSKPIVKGERRVSHSGFGLASSTLQPDVFRTLKIDGIWREG